jgi:hypothetical protein
VKKRISGHAFPHVWIVRLDDYAPMAYDTWKGAENLFKNVNGVFKTLSIERVDADFETVRGPLVSAVGRQKRKKR